MKGKVTDDNPYGAPPCPICGGNAKSRCKCNYTHTIEHLKKGHGYKCANGHRFSWEGLSYDPGSEVKKAYDTDSEDWRDRVELLKKRIVAKLTKSAAITLDIEKGDTLLGGRFKNVKHVVKEIGTDSNGQPTVNGMKLLSFRIAKQMKSALREHGFMEKVAGLSPEMYRKAVALSSELRISFTEALQELSRRSKVVREGNTISARQRAERLAPIPPKPVKQPKPARGADHPDLF